MALLPHQKRVGAGLDYETIPLWFATESTIDYGTEIEALCTGNVGANVTLSGATVNGLIPKITTLDVEYNGKNESALAVIDRLNLQTVVNMTDMKIISTNRFVAPFTKGAGSNGSILDRIRVRTDDWSGVDAISMNEHASASNVKRIVASGGVNVIDFGYQRILNTGNMTVFGADGDGFEGSGNVSTTTNSFSLSNGANDYVNIQRVNCASEDATGDYVGYTSAEFVDPANDNYQIKQTSPLHALGVGSFFEESAVQPVDLVFSDNNSSPSNQIISIESIAVLSLSNTQVNHSLDTITIEAISELALSDNLSQPASDLVVIGLIDEVLLLDNTTQPITDRLSISTVQELVISDNLRQPTNDEVLLTSVQELVISDNNRQPSVDQITIAEQGIIPLSDTLRQPVVDRLSIELYTELDFLSTSRQPSVDSVHLTFKSMPNFGIDDLVLTDVSQDYQLTDNSLDYSLTDNTIDYKAQYNDDICKP